MACFVLLPTVSAVGGDQIWRNCGIRLHTTALPSIGRVPDHTALNSFGRRSILLHTLPLYTCYTHGGPANIPSEIVVVLLF